MSNKGIVNPRVIEEIVSKAPTIAEGCKRVTAFVREGLEKGTFTPEQFSFKGLAIALGVVDPYDMENSFRYAVAEARDSSTMDERKVFTESNPTVTTNTFQIVTGELVARKVIEGYDSDEGYIGEQLVETMPNQRLRNQRITGLTALAGPLEVNEGHPYPESGFDEKFVITKESKKGRILSLTEELILFDQVGEIMRRARNLGFMTRQERERTIVRGVIDADSSTDPVYRPSGTGEALYATDATNLNYVGVGGLTGYDGAIALADWTDVNEVIKFRATQITDDRTDGTQRPIMGLNGPQNVLLVPVALQATAAYIVGQTTGEKRTNSAADVTMFQQNPVSRFLGGWLSSPFIDEANASDWYYGNPKRQFVWTEIWPVQTFTMGRESADEFERDVAFRIKCRYYGGISATDTVHVTKVDGA